MLRPTRQFIGFAGRPPRVQPSTYCGQWLFTQIGCRKFAERGSQPRTAASATPLENGATAVTTIGGCGRCKGLPMIPCPISGRYVRLVEMFQYFPRMSQGGSLV